jgi:hypothetical protein
MNRNDGRIKQAIQLPREKKRQSGFAEQVEKKGKSMLKLA